MTPGERKSASNKLRKAAERAIREEASPIIYSDVKTNRRGQMVITVCNSADEAKRKMDHYWRAFPENEFDKSPVPSPQEVIAICDRMDRDEAADKKFAETIKGL